MKTVGERIKQARLAKKLSGKKLAELAGYRHQSAIGNLENRSSGVGGYKITKLAEVLEVSVAWLLNGPDCENVPFIRTDKSRHEAAHNEANQINESDASAVSNSFYIKPREEEPIFKKFTIEEWKLLPEPVRITLEDSIEASIIRHVRNAAKTKAA